MDIVSLYYFKELADDLNMTKTAERLFISQQTLSNHIQRLEKEYGTTLFYRKPRLALTEAGRIMLDFSLKVLREEKQLKNIIFDIENQERGLLRFGASNMRSNNCLPQLLPKFSARYPQVEIQVTDSPSIRLEKLVQEGALDLAICVLDDNPMGIHAQLVLSDQIYLCVSNRLLDKYYGSSAQELKKRAHHDGAQVKDFIKLPFFMLSKPNRLGSAIAKCFEEAECKPDIYLSTSYTRMAASICSDALAACFMTKMALVETLDTLAEDVCVFSLLYKSKPVYHQVYLVNNSKQYLPHYTKYFMELLIEQFARMDAINLIRQ